MKKINKKYFKMIFLTIPKQSSPLIPEQSSPLIPEQSSPLLSEGKTDIPAESSPFFWNIKKLNSREGKMKFCRIENDQKDMKTLNVVIAYKIDYQNKR